MAEIWGENPHENFVVADLDYLLESANPRVQNSDSDGQNLNKN